MLGKPYFRFMESKVVIVTGAGSGIGKEIARKWAAKGAHVVLAGRRSEPLQALQEELKPLPGKRLVVPADVGKKEDCKVLIDKTVEAFGRIDLLVNNAGISMRALFRDLDLEVLEKLMQVNFWGTTYCSYYALPYLLQSKGSIIGISSVAGYQGLPGRTGYCASKFAMHGLLNTLRVEYKNQGLHVLICCPGFTASNIRKTALNAAGETQGESPRDEQKMMQPQEVAQALFKAWQKRKRFLVLTAQGKLTWWLSRFFPAFVDAQVLKHFQKESESPV